MAMDAKPLMLTNKEIRVLMCEHASDFILYMREENITPKAAIVDGLKRLLELAEALQE